MSVPKVWGYLINDDALLQYGISKGYGTDTDIYERSETMIRAFIDVASRTQIFGHARWVCVIVNGKMRRCIALADNDPYRPLRMPPRRMVDSLKAFLRTEKEPRWYVEEG